MHGVPPQYAAVVRNRLDINLTTGAVRGWVVLLLTGALQEHLTSHDSAYTMGWDFVFLGYVKEAVYKTTSDIWIRLKLPSGMSFLTYVESSPSRHADMLVTGWQS